MKLCRSPFFLKPSLEQNVYISFCTDSALSKDNFHLHDNICMGSCGRERCDAPGDQTAPQKSCTLSKQEKVTQSQRLRGLKLLHRLNKLTLHAYGQYRMPRHQHVIESDRVSFPEIRVSKELTLYALHKNEEKKPY